MADLLSEQHSLLSMSSEELLEHIKQVRSRRRENAKPKARAAKKKAAKAKAKTKDLLVGLSVADIKKLLELASDRNNN